MEPTALDQSLYAQYIWQNPKHSKLLGVRCKEYFLEIYDFILTECLQTLPRKLNAAQEK